MSENSELDGLLAAYNAANEEWIAAIREAEQLAVPDHSMRDWETWDHATLRVEDAGRKADESRKAYEEGLRRELLNF